MGTGTYFSDTVKRNTSRSRSRRRRRGGPTGPLRKWTLPISTSPNSKTEREIGRVHLRKGSSNFDLPELQNCPRHKVTRVREKVVSVRRRNEGFDNGGGSRDP